MESALPAWAPAALLGVGVVAGFVNVVAGGGSLITMPMLVFLGLPAGVANGTARLAILVQNCTAVWRYRAAGRLDLAAVRRLCPPALLGAVAGAAVSVWLGDFAFRQLLAAVMLGCALLVALGPNFDEAGGGALQARPAWLVWPLMLAIGFYGGLVQAGVGYLILFGFTRLLRMPLIDANVMKVVVVLCYTPVALAVFVAHDQVAFLPGLYLAAGQALGAVLGATAALRRGSGFVRSVLVVVVVLSALRLFGVV